MFYISEYMKMLHKSFWCPCNMLAVEIWELRCKSNSLPVDRKYQKGNLREHCIILLFNSKYKRRWTSLADMRVSGWHYMA
jgi:hypothetical protein